jgi:hypothetical protein
VLRFRAYSARLLVFACVAALRLGALSLRLASRPVEDAVSSRNCKWPLKFSCKRPTTLNPLHVSHLPQSELRHPEVNDVPILLANLGLIVAGTISTGGLAALAIKRSRKKNHPTETIPNANERSDEDADTHSR